MDQFICELRVSFLHQVEMEVIMNCHGRFCNRNATLNLVCMQLNNYQSDDEISYCQCLFRLIFSNVLDYITRRTMILDI